jgi:hypothetical protein
MIEILLPRVERDIIPPPPPPAKYLHQKSQELTLILRKVEMSEIVEILSD